MTKIIKTGVVGAGRMGGFHVLNLSEILEVSLVAVSDVDESKKSVANKYKVDFYTDYRELYGKVDAVSIAVPTAFHYQVTKDFLENGIHVLLEKPIAPSLKES